MADNVSPETGSEPAELSLEDAAKMLAQPEKPDDADTEAPDDEQDTSQDDAPEAPEGEGDEAGDDDASEQDAEPDVKDDVLIKMDDGSTLTVAELKAEAVNLKTENARISQEAADERRELQQTGKKVTEIFDSVLRFLADRLPAEPDPQLLWTDPSRHHQMSYLRNQAVAELQSLLQAKGETESAVDNVTEAELQKMQSTEEAKLIAAVPNLKDPARRKAALEKAKTYAKSIGFTDDDFDKTLDHRIRRMVIDAAYGRDAREAALKAKAQVKSATAKGPVAQRAVHPNSLRALNNTNALKRAKETGSIEDVLKYRLSTMG